MAKPTPYTEKNFQRSSRISKKCIKIDQFHLLSILKSLNNPKFCKNKIIHVYLSRKLHLTQVIQRPLDPKRTSSGLKLTCYKKLYTSCSFPTYLFRDGSETCLAGMSSQDLVVRTSSIQFSSCFMI